MGRGLGDLPGAPPALARFADVVEGSIEAGTSTTVSAPEAPKRAPGGDSALAKYATDLTQRAARKPGRGWASRPRILWCCMSDV